MEYSQKVKEYMYSKYLVMSASSCLGFVNLSFASMNKLIVYALIALAMLGVLIFIDYKQIRWASSYFNDNRFFLNSNKLLITWLVLIIGCLFAINTPIYLSYFFATLAFIALGLLCIFSITLSVPSEEFNIFTSMQKEKFQKFTPYANAIFYIFLLLLFYAINDKNSNLAIGLGMLISIGVFFAFFTDNLFSKIICIGTTITLFFSWISVLQGHSSFNIEKAMPYLFAVTIASANRNILLSLICISTPTITTNDAPATYIIFALLYLIINLNIFDFKKTLNWFWIVSLTLLGCGVFCYLRVFSILECFFVSLFILSFTIFSSFFNTKLKKSHYLAILFIFLGIANLFILIRLLHFQFLPIDYAIAFLEKICNHIFFLFVLLWYFSTSFPFKDRSHKSLVCSLIIFCIGIFVAFKSSSIFMGNYLFHFFPALILLLLSFLLQKYVSFHFSLLMLIFAIHKIILGVFFINMTSLDYSSNPYFTIATISSVIYAISQLWFAYTSETLPPLQSNQNIE